MPVHRMKAKPVPFNVARHQICSLFKSSFSPTEKKRRKKWHRGKRQEWSRRSGKEQRVTWGSLQNTKSQTDSQKQEGRTGPRGRDQTGSQIPLQRYIWGIIQHLEERKFHHRVSRQQVTSGDVFFTSPVGNITLLTLYPEKKIVNQPHSH